MQRLVNVLRDSWFAFFVSCGHLLSESVRGDGVNGAVLYRNLKGVSRLPVCVHKLTSSIMHLSDGVI